jgi:hypothetical protein
MEESGIFCDISKLLTTENKDNTPRTIPPQAVHFQYKELHKIVALSRKSLETKMHRDVRLSPDRQKFAAPGA